VETNRRAYLKAFPEPLPLRKPVLGRHLETPKAGAVERDLIISGWVVHDRPEPLRLLLLDAQGSTFGHTWIDRERSDVAASFPDSEQAPSSGFRVRVPATVARALPELTVVLDAGDEQVPVWRIGIAAVTQLELDAEDRERGGEGRPRRLWPAKRRRTENRPAGDAPPARPAVDGQAPGGQSSALAVRAPGPRVMALISTFNEADVIGPVLDHLSANGVTSYVIDNGSTDDTLEHVRRRIGDTVVGVESLPRKKDGTASWRAILSRKAELARELGADWYMHYDADEIRESPWPGMTLREAIAIVDQLGYNAVGFRVVNFPPVDDGYRPGDDPREYFHLWEDPAEYDRMQRKCWKAGPYQVNLEDGGHDVQFPERRLFPLRFILRHYPIRGQGHGTRKVMRERRGLFAAEEVAFGWHRQYDHVHGPEHMFLKNPASLRSFDLERLRFETLLEDAANAPNPSDVEVAAANRRPGRVQGMIDRVAPDVIAGWAISDDDPQAAVTLDIWDGPIRLASVVADRPRPDLGSRGLGDGSVGGFSIRTPRELIDGRPHWIWVSVPGAETALRRSPLVLHVPDHRPAATAREVA